MHGRRNDSHARTLTRTERTVSRTEQTVTRRARGKVRKHADNSQTQSGKLVRNHLLSSTTELSIRFLLESFLLWRILVAMHAKRGSPRSDRTLGRYTGCGNAVCEHGTSKIRPCAGVRAENSKVNAENSKVNADNSKVNVESNSTKKGRKRNFKHTTIVPEGHAASYLSQSHRHSWTRLC